MTQGEATEHTHTHTHTHTIFKNLSAAEGNSERGKKTGKRRKTMREKDSLCKGQ